MSIELASAGLPQPSRRPRRPKRRWSVRISWPRFRRATKRGTSRMVSGVVVEPEPVTLLPTDQLAAPEPVLADVTDTGTLSITSLRAALAARTVPAPPAQPAIEAYVPLASCTLYFTFAQLTTLLEELEATMPGLDQALVEHPSPYTTVKHAFTHGKIRDEACELEVLIRWSNDRERYIVSLKFSGTPSTPAHDAHTAASALATKYSKGITCTYDQHYVSGWGPRPFPAAASEIAA